MVKRLERACWLEREQGGGVVLAGGELVLPGGPCFVGHLDDALTITLADDPQALGLPVAAVESEDLRDPSSGGQQRQNQRSVAFVGQRVAGQCVQELIPVSGFQGLGEPFGQRRHIDGGAEVVEEPFLAGGEAQEAAQLDEPTGSGWRWPAAVGRPGARCVPERGGVGNRGGCRGPVRRCPGCQRSR
jgi:hypothetical protein